MNSSFYDFLYYYINFFVYERILLKFHNTCYILVRIHLYIFFFVENWNYKLFL